MDDQERICKLLVEREDLSDEVKRLKESMTAIRGILYCIGGPLNDNVRQYTRDQLQPFFQIASHCDDN